MCVSCPSVTKAQWQQLQEDELEKNRILQKNNDTFKKKMDAAMNAVGKHSRGKILVQ